MSFLKNMFNVIQWKLCCSWIKGSFKSKAWGCPPIRRTVLSPTSVRDWPPSQGLRSNYEICPLPIASGKKTSTGYHLAMASICANPERDLCNFHSWASLLWHADSIRSTGRVLALLVQVVRWAKSALKQKQDRRHSFPPTPQRPLPPRTVVQQSWVFL